MRLYMSNATCMLTEEYKNGFLYNFLYPKDLYTWIWQIWPILKEPHNQSFVWKI